jgi:hypothetical protein
LTVSSAMVRVAMARAAVAAIIVRRVFFISKGLFEICDLNFFNLVG